MPTAQAKPQFGMLPALFYAGHVLECEGERQKALHLFPARIIDYYLPRRLATVACHIIFSAAQYRAIQPILKFFYISRVLPILQAFLTTLIQSNRAARGIYAGCIYEENTPGTSKARAPINLMRSRIACECSHPKRRVPAMDVGHLKEPLGEKIRRSQHSFSEPNSTCAGKNGTYDNSCRGQIYRSTNPTKGVI